MLLLDEDLVGHVGQFTLVTLTILDLEHGKSAICTRRVQVLVVVAQTYTHNHLRVSLNLEQTVFAERVHHTLDGTWLVCLVDASEEGASIELHLDLVQVDVLFKFLNLLPVLDLSDRLVRASHKDRWEDLPIFGLIDFKAGEVDVGLCEGPDWSLVALAFLRVQPPHVDVRVESGRDEACIVLQPRD